MSHANSRSRVESLLSLADVQIDGNNPWDVQVHNDAVYRRMLARDSLGLGEAYMDGWWDCDGLDELFHRIFRAGFDTRVKPWVGFLKSRLMNPQKLSRAFHVGQRHYDIGNNLYQLMLGELLIYSCGYWKQASTLNEAQEAKLDLICRKLDFCPGMRVLDIGCGWGGTAKFAAERYEVEVVGITVSEEQAKFGAELCRGLPVEIRLDDYRGLKGTFDRIVSVGMFEHVGYKNYGRYFRVVNDCLRDDGLFLLQTIGNNRSVTKIDPWIERYIFPNSMIPSANQISRAAEGLFVLEDWHSFGTDYDKTLMHWFQNFHESWKTVAKDYGERFYRMWKYYLLSSAGSFRARRSQAWQIVFSPQGVSGGYQSLR